MQKKAKLHKTCLFLLFAFTRFAGCWCSPVRIRLIEFAPLNSNARKQLPENNCTLKKCQNPFISFVSVISRSGGGSIQKYQYDKRSKKEKGRKTFSSRNIIIIFNIKLSKLKPIFTQLKCCLYFCVFKSVKHYYKTIFQEYFFIKTSFQ